MMQTLLPRRTTRRLGALGWLVSSALACLRSADATSVIDVDVFQALQRERAARRGVSTTEKQTHASLIRAMLLDPSSPYSELQPAPFFMNDVAWATAVSSLPGPPITDQQALDVMRWDLGLTKARPDIDVAVGSGEGFRDRFVAASARKADVDPDIFWHMLTLTGYRHSTKAAYYAVAMQMLRRQMAEVPARRHAALGIDAATFQRVMQAYHLGQVPEHDLRYLSTLVQHRLIHWRVGGKASTGLRELPVAFRIARVAAAYRDADGYFMGAPCTPDALPDKQVAGSGQPGDYRDLCLVAATDRAVHRWYLQEMRNEARLRPDRRHARSSQLLASLIAMVMPLFEMANILEVMEAAVADDLLAADAIGVDEAEVAAERADLLTCRIPE